MTPIIGLGASVLPTEISDAITTGMTDSGKMIVTVIGLCFAGVVTVILTSGGANFALRKIRSIFSWA